jgi:tetratricopeptide (TPR) repeat protein
MGDLYAPTREGMDFVRRPAGFLRCPACGRRAYLEEARCELHGPIADSTGREGGAPIDPPTIPGFRALRSVGRGGFGAVFSASPEDGGAVIAIKVAHLHPPAAAPKLLHETEVLADVGPPHVPRVLSSGRLANGAPWVAMEYIDAPTLADVLARGPLAVERAIELITAVLSALAAVHARGWVHLDLKPENLFITGNTAKIVDFGLGAAEGAIDATTEHGAGTAEYMAPEQCAGHGRIDVRSDVYAMGIILHELVAGAPPFWGAPAVVRLAHLNLRPPKLSSVATAVVSPELDAVVQRCLAKDPGERFESAAALAAALAALPTGVRLGRLPDGERAEGRKVAEGARHPDERRRAALLFFETSVDAIAVQHALDRLGAELAHARGARIAAISLLGANPVRAAHRAAEELCKSGVALRVRVDVAMVSVQHRADGSRRYFCPLFAQGGSFPTLADPGGVSLTTAAGEALATTVEARADTISIIGRERVLEELLASARRAARERSPAVVRVVAREGLGKSHLARVLSAKLLELEPEAEILELRARDPSLGGADYAVRELLTRALDLPDHPPASGDRLLRDALARVERVETFPAVALALGWTGTDAGLRNLGAAPGALRSALTEAAAAAVLARARRRPLFVVLDDAHHADEAALAALDRAAGSTAGGPLWICALGRPLLAEEHPTWGERAARREDHVLEALDRESAARLTRQLLLPVDDVPVAAVERLVDRTQANPLLLVELIRGLRRAGLVLRRPRGDGYYLATDELDRLPDLPLVEWQAQGEIDALPDALKAHARLVALMGDEVVVADTAGVLRYLDDEQGTRALPLDAKVGVAQLIEGGILVADGAGRVAFRHALVREAIAKQVPDDLRARIHRAAVAHYGSALKEPRRGKELAELAFHAARAGETTLAREAYLTLAERARARHAYVDAERAYSRALDQSHEAPDTLRARRGRGLCRYRTGRYHDALDDLAAARSLARSAGDVGLVCEILLDEATALDWMLDYPLSAERVDEAQKLFPKAAGPAQRARLLLAIGRSAHRSSRDEDAAWSLECAAELASGLGNDGYETLVITLVTLGVVCIGLGRLEDARATLDRAIRLAEERHDDLHVGAAIANRALLCFFRGDFDGMVADMAKGLALARKLGQPSVELVAEVNLAEGLYLLDQLDAAEPHVQRAFALERRRTGGPLRPSVALVGARLHHYKGEIAEAREAVRSVRAAHDDASSLEQTDLRMAPAEEILCDMVDLATRGATAEEWDALEDRSSRSSVGMEQIEVLEARAIAALREGRPKEAVTRMEKAILAADRVPNAMGARLRRGLEHARDAASGNTRAGDPATGPYASGAGSAPGALPFDRTA